MRTSPVRDASYYHRNAFTLVELLIVVAIVALLAAILLPVFNKVQDSSKTSSCQSNLRQIGIAMELYASDYRGIYPSSYAASTNCTWSDAAAQYAKSDTIFTCPKAPEQFYQTGCLAEATVDGVGHDYDGGYLLNIPDSERSSIVNQNRIRTPTQMILVTEGNSPGHVTYVRNGVGPLTDELLKYTNLEFRHNNGVNALFADGHIKWLTKDTLRDRKYWSSSGRS